MPSNTAYAIEPAAKQPPPLASVHGHVFTGYRAAERPVGGRVKRAMDLVIAGVATLALAPALLLLALLIKLDSRGPVIFAQRRRGFRGRAFKIYKFRTMNVLEDGRAFSQVKRDDPRVTRIGRILRKTSLDELPQLFNVLKGDMSLVGPRPHALVHDHAFRQHDDAYAMRRVARPGITGLAQVSGARGVTDSEERIEARIKYDIEYVAHWSVWRDMTILARTVGVLICDPDAV